MHFHRGTMRWLIGDSEGAVEDYEDAYVRLGYPTFVLVDLETMEVLVQDCYGDGTPASWAACIESHL